MTDIIRPDEKIWGQLGRENMAPSLGRVSWQTPPWKPPKGREGFHTGATRFPRFTFYDEMRGESTAPISRDSIPESLGALENQFNSAALTSMAAQSSQGAQELKLPPRTSQSLGSGGWPSGYTATTQPVPSRHILLSFPDTSSKAEKRRIEPSWSTDNICSNHEVFKHQK